MTPTAAIAARHSSSSKSHSAARASAKSSTKTNAKKNAKDSAKVSSKDRAKVSTKTSARAGSRRSRGKKQAVVSSIRRTRGQQAIEPERVTEIQQALIREKYLDGDADGNWDSRSIAAMQKFQADQGWQTKLMPDSRALKKLGLGADYSNALNAKEIPQTNPAIQGTTTPEQAEGFAAAARVKR